MIMPSSSSSNREAKVLGPDQSPNPNQITDLNQVGWDKSFCSREGDGIAQR